MAAGQVLARIVGVVAVAAFAESLVVSSALAQDTSSCVCVVDAGAVGLVTSATGWVKLNGDSGLVDASPNAPLSLGSVLKTGVAGSASASVGSSCNVEVAALSQMTITALENGQMCVRLTQEQPIVAPISPVAIVGGGALLAGGAIVVGLGQENPVSQ